MSLVDPTSTDSIIVRGPLQFSRLLKHMPKFAQHIN